MQNQNDDRHVQFIGAMLVALMILAVAASLAVLFVSSSILASVA